MYGCRGGGGFGAFCVCGRMRRYFTNRRRRWGVCRTVCVRPCDRPGFVLARCLRFPFFGRYAIVSSVAKATPRLQVQKTYKLYIGGKFVRGESGRVSPARAADDSEVLANYCRASRKDFRDAVVAARAAFGG